MVLGKELPVDVLCSRFLLGVFSSICKLLEAAAELLSFTCGTESAWLRHRRDGKLVGRFVGRYIGRKVGRQVDIGRQTGRYIAR